MAGGYDMTPVDPLDVLRAQLVDMKARLAELERPTGTQLFNAVRELTALVDDLQTQVDNLLAVAVNTGDVNATGDVHVDGDIYTPHGRVTPVTTNYIGAWINSDGRIGASASSVIYKQDFQPANVDPLIDALLSVSLVRFRYIDAVKALGDDAGWELGAIAEYFATIGLDEYVFTTADGAPMGINYERLTIPLIAVVQRLHEQSKERDARMTALEKRLADAGL